MLSKATGKSAQRETARPPHYYGARRFRRVCTDAW
jgi:hypothetical protein